MRPDQASNSICTTGEAAFTITKTETRKTWPSPTIFYLADLFEEDDEVGVQSWERSVGSNGELRETDIFYEGE